MNEVGVASEYCKVEEIPDQELLKDPAYPLNPKYCTNCSLPLDFCGLSKNSRCESQSLKDNLDSTSGLENDSAPSGELIEQKVNNEKKSKSKAKSKEKYIYIRSVPRSQKKFTTTITGLSIVGVKISEISKNLSKKFACSASFSEQNDEIVLQGDISNDLAEYILLKYPEKVTSDIIIMKSDKK